MTTLKREDRPSYTRGAYRTRAWSAATTGVRSPRLSGRPSERFIVPAASRVRPPLASAFSVEERPEAWIAQLYDQVAEDRHDEAIDLIYDRLEGMLELDPGACDELLRILDPDCLSAEEVVAVLMITLPAKHLLNERDGFIARARPLLDQEPEGSAEVLRGLQ